MSRKQAPPKPEELIAKLDEKFESFREEITGVIAEKSSEIDQINAKDLIDKNALEILMLHFHFSIFCKVAKCVR